MNKFVLKLIDDYADSRYEERVSYYTVETDKTLTEVVDAYNEARDEWYDAEPNDFDCLIAHIVGRLEEKGMNMNSLSCDAEVEF